MNFFKYELMDLNIFVVSVCCNYDLCLIVSCLANENHFKLDFGSFDMMLVASIVFLLSAMTDCFSLIMYILSSDQESPISSKCGT